ncbi:isocitrate dehydrogenase kinase/phosphatase [Escherichia coli]|uniref:Isocitrate dehydrogenase kinase/phosphatase n=1 Tax=Escherichia coli TaxID=562 RepID=A0A377DZB7_ECOLX|nr:isocitrate dehydrogenase kinase/phosphatase [Escherichia coli]STM41393.1 isocitrate dehydrogenase kinase/phosphatase [Escherichia coli]
MPRGLELLIAQTILQGFDAQYGRFLEVTSGAQQRFEQADWHAVQQAMKKPYPSLRSSRWSGRGATALHY